MPDLSATHPVRRLPAWAIFLASGAVTITVAESALLALGTGYFGNGFNTVALSTWDELAGFVVCSLVVDAGLLLVCWGLLTPLLRRGGLGGMRLWWLLMCLCVGIPVLLAGYRYNVYAIAGATFTVDLLHRTTWVSSSSMISELVWDEGFIWIVPVALGFLAMLAVTRWLGMLERRHPDWSDRLTLPRSGRSLVIGASILLVSTLVIRLTDADVRWLRYGIERKGADIATQSAIGMVTDLDGDGFGPLTALADPDPLDPSRHPYAIEIPGNGIDDNGIGGDLAPSPLSDAPIEAPLPGPGARPHVLVLYLESFRRDLLQSEVDGRPVTPFLDSLAREGGSTRFAFAHTAWTIDSRAHLFTGEIVPTEGTPTLIDDFVELGYEVLYFSGQDESYGDSEPMLGSTGPTTSTTRVRTSRGDRRARRHR